MTYILITATNKETGVVEAHIVTHQTNARLDFLALQEKHPGCAISCRKVRCAPECRVVYQPRPGEVADKEYG